MEKSVMYPWIFLLITLCFFTYSTIDSEEKIKGLEEVIDIKSQEIDSLYVKVDSLVIELESEIGKYDIKNKIEHYRNGFINLLDAIIKVESSDNDSAYHKGEDAVGCLQIRRTMVDDVNRILKRKGASVDEMYTYGDRWERGLSIQMFEIYCNHYNLTQAEDIARCWNGGPRGNNKPTTVYYWNKVKSELDS